MTTPRTNASHDQNFEPTLLGVSTLDGKTPVPVEVNPVTGAIQIEGSTGGGGGTSGGTLVTVAFDYVEVTYPDAVTEVYTYKSGGSGGTTVATVTVVYSDSTKANISTITKV